MDANQCFFRIRLMSSCLRTTILLVAIPHTEMAVVIGPGADALLRKHILLVHIVCVTELELQARTSCVSLLFASVSSRQCLVQLRVYWT